MAPRQEHSDVDAMLDRRLQLPGANVSPEASIETSSSVRVLTSIIPKTCLTYWYVTFADTALC